LIELHAVLFKTLDKYSHRDSKLAQASLQPSET